LEAKKKDNKPIPTWKSEGPSNSKSESKESSFGGWKKPLELKPEDRKRLADAQAWSAKKTDDKPGPTWVSSKPSGQTKTDSWQTKADNKTASSWATTASWQKKDVKSDSQTALSEKKPESKETKVPQNKPLWEKKPESKTQNKNSWSISSKSPWQAKTSVPTDKPPSVEIKSGSTLTSPKAVNKTDNVSKTVTKAAPKKNLSWFTEIENPTLDEIWEEYFEKMILKNPVSMHFFRIMLPNKNGNAFVFFNDKRIKITDLRGKTVKEVTESDVKSIGIELILSVFGCEAPIPTNKIGIESAISNIKSWSPSETILSLFNDAKFTEDVGVDTTTSKLSLKKGKKIVSFEGDGDSIKEARDQAAYNLIRTEDMKVKYCNALPVLKPETWVEKLENYDEDEWDDLLRICESKFKFKVIWKIEDNVKWRNSTTSDWQTGVRYTLEAGKIKTIFIADEKSDKSKMQAGRQLLVLIEAAFGKLSS